MLFDGSKVLENGWIDDSVRGLLDEPIMNFDSAMSSEVCGKLFRYVLFHLLPHTETGSVDKSPSIFIYVSGAINL